MRLPLAAAGGKACDPAKAQMIIISWRSRAVNPLFELPVAMPGNNVIPPSTLK